MNKQFLKDAVGWGFVLWLQFRKEARRRRVGYQTLIHEVLARHARKDVA